MNIGRYHSFPIPTPSTIITIVGTPRTSGDGREYRVSEHSVAAIRFQYLNDEERSAGATARTSDVVSLVDAFCNSKVFDSYLEADLEAWRLGGFSDLSYIVQVAELEPSWDTLLIQAEALRGAPHLTT